MNYKFRTKAACRIAGIDHQRFNEDVAAGEYPPRSSDHGGWSSRVLRRGPIFAGLYVYAHLTRGCGEDVPVSARGPAATYARGCDFRHFVASFPF